MSFPLHSPAWFQDFRRRITRWYDANRRSLPWRETHDPYAIWISEAMLQQTQVATVIDYYHRFLERFPDVASLAAADEQAVLQQWAGLGYYRRARQLHAAAKQMVEQGNGEFPRRLEEIQQLPGIGRYTAGAIASFAYDARAPIVEANTLRLFSRLLALREPPQRSAAQRQLWAFAEQLLPPRRGSGRLNQACMELGSLLCAPQRPACTACPVQSLCPAFAAGIETEIPVAQPKPATSAIGHVAVVIRHRGRLLMRQNPPGEWWHGLWDFPRSSLETSPELLRALTASEAANAESLEAIRWLIEQSHGLACQPVRRLCMLKHSVTRYRISLFCFEATVASSSLKKMTGRWTWVEDPPQLPLTSPAQQLLRRLGD